MEDIEFNEDNFTEISNTSNEITTNKFSMFLINTGIAKDTKQANVIMLITAVILIIVTVAIYKTSVFPNKPKTVPYEQLDYAEKMKIPEAIRKTIEGKN
jgi:hypothetical protein